MERPTLNRNWLDIKTSGQNNYILRSRRMCSYVSVLYARLQSLSRKFRSWLSEYNLREIALSADHLLSDFLLPQSSSINVPRRRFTSVAQKATLICLLQLYRHVIRHHYYTIFLRPRRFTTMPTNSSPSPPSRIPINNRFLARHFRKRFLSHSLRTLSHR